MLYLTAGSPYAGIIGLAAFLPQLILIVVCSLKFHKDPPMAFFLNTFIFVTFNKVCTSQVNGITHFTFFSRIVPQGSFYTMLGIANSEKSYYICSCMALIYNSFSECIWLFFFCFLLVLSLVPVFAAFSVAQFNYVHFKRNHTHCSLASWTGKLFNYTTELCMKHCVTGWEK